MYSVVAWGWGEDYGVDEVVGGLVHGVDNDRLTRGRGTDVVGGNGPGRGVVPFLQRTTTSNYMLLGGGKTLPVGNGSGITLFNEIRGSDFFINGNSNKSMYTPCGVDFTSNVRGGKGVRVGRSLEGVCGS